MCSGLDIVAYVTRPLLKNYNINRFLTFENLEFLKNLMKIIYARKDSTYPIVRYGKIYSLCVVTRYDISIKMLTIKILHLTKKVSN